MTDPEQAVATEMATPPVTPRRRAPRPNPREAAAMRAALEDPNRPRGPVPLYSFAEAATFCRRRPSTIRDIVYRNALPHVKAWKTRPSGRRARVTLLEASVVALLQRVTVFAPSRARRKQGASIVGEMIRSGMAGR